MSYYQTKFLSIRPMGWKRICKNTMRFGWELTDAKEHTTTETKTTYKETHYYDRVEVTPETTTKTTRRIHLSFVRYPEKFENLGEIKLWETLYGIAYLFRTIALFFTKLIWVLTLLVALIGEIAGEVGTPLSSGAVVITLIWLGLRLTENIFAHIAAKRLELR